MNARLDTNAQMWVVKVMPIGANKVEVTYANGTRKEMSKAVAEQIIRDVKNEPSI